MWRRPAGTRGVVSTLTPKRCSDFRFGDVESLGRPTGRKLRGGAPELAETDRFEAQHLAFAQGHWKEIGNSLGRC